MKRLFLISFLLLFLGTMYADGPRYRFKSRRALQNLWRKEMKENPKGYYGNGKSRDLSSREQLGEGDDERADRYQYGIVVADPFSDLKLGNENDDDSDNGFYAKAGKINGKITDRGGNGLKPYIKPGTGPITPNNPFIGGKVNPKKGQDRYEPPKSPVGDGLHILLILSAALIVIKKRLSK